MRQAYARAAGKRGFTLIELLVVVAIIALLISILMPSLARARELSKRTVCASNMKGIGVGFASYAAANNDAWPIPNHPKPDTSTGAGLCKVTYLRAIGAKRGNAVDPAAGETFGSNPTIEKCTDLYISTTRAFWQLVRGGNTPKSFVCPSASTDVANTDENPQSYWDFGTTTTGFTPPNTSDPNASKTPSVLPTDYKGGWSQCSYGYQVPFGRNGNPSPTVDPDMAMVADKGPFGAYTDGDLTPMPDINSGVTKDSSPEEWKKLNSPNHGGFGDGEGQNVMYNDGHAEFFTTPLCGVAKDNIYTRWPNDNPSTAQRALGIGPSMTTGSLAPYGQTDSLIYP